MQLPKDYNQQEINLHRAAQLISLTGVNMIQHLPDDSHTTMVWDEPSNLLLGRSFQISQNSYHIGIRLFPFQLALYDDSLKTIQSIDLGGMDEPALYSIWGDWLRNLGYQEELVKEVHYELPHTPAYHAMRLQGLEKEFVGSWSNLRSLSNTVMATLNSVKGIESEINIWPHHFDTGVYYSITTQNEETIQSIGAGLAIADSMIGEPYFYIYGWTKNGAINFSKAPALKNGKWLTNEWKGAVLSASNIQEGNAEKQVNEFMKEAFDFLNNELKRNN